MRVLCLPGREWSRAKREEDVSEKEREEVVAVTKEEENIIIIIITERVFCYNNVLTTFVKKPQKYELDKSPTNAMHACMENFFGNFTKQFSLEKEYFQKRRDDVHHHPHDERFVSASAAAPDGSSSSSSSRADLLAKKE